MVKTYGQVMALNNVNVTITSGQQVAIMGPSGSGKSTLLHCLAGILTPDSGSVFLGNIEMSKQSDSKRSKLRLHHFGFVFQDSQLVPELSACENVAVPLLLEGMKRRDAFRLADEWLYRLGVSNERNRRPGEMSGGQMQRVAIARAMAGKPDVIFADEPTGALDQATGHEVMQILSTTAQGSGTTLITVTHDREVAKWCHRLIEIRDGRIHADTDTSASHLMSGLSPSIPEGQADMPDSGLRSAHYRQIFNTDGGARP